MRLDMQAQQLPKINGKAGAQIAFPWGTYLHFHGPEGSVRTLATRVFAPLQLEYIIIIKICRYILTKNILTISETK